MADYFTRPREDGKYDVLEGTELEPGRIVTTLDTPEAAADYITDLHRETDDLIAELYDSLDEPADALEAAMDEEDTVPYKLANKDGKTCVVKKSDGSVVKCHDDRADAEAHLRALYVNQADALVQAAIDALPEEDSEVIVGDVGTTTTGDMVLIPDTHSRTWTTSTTSTNVLPVVAHAPPPAPPASFFTDPQFDKLQRYVTITPDGRFMTHLAAWGECHVGYGDMCVSPPREADYSHFAVGSVLTSDGTTIPTGVIAITGGHADVSLDAASARSKYDDTATGKVDVVIGTDEFGIWASGAMRPNATEADVHTLRASGVSGDWRLIDGELRLIGICAVNVPGFPKLAMAASADTITALVAAGGPPVPHPDLCDCKDMTADIIEELDNLQRIVADAGLEDMVIEKLASRVLSDDDLDTLYERIIK